MIQLSEESKRLASTFRTYRNDLDIYTEDNEKDKEFYKVLFKRLVSSNISISDITPLGSKKNVINRCKEEPDNGRKKIFIIDGDVNIIHGNNVPQLKNLYVLNGYCIENLLINKETVMQYIYMNCGTKPIEKIEAEVDYDKWLNTYTEKLIDLFLHFALIDFFGGNFTLFNANKYHRKIGNDFQFQPSAVEKDILKLKEELAGLTSEDNYQTKYSELKNNWPISIEHLLTIVSGKDYLIPILLFKTRDFKQSKSFPTLEEIKFNIVHYANLERLGHLKNTIEAL